MLDKETEVFERMRDDLLKNHRGKFVVIHEEEFLGAFDTAQNAYGEGIRVVGTSEPFLVKQVVKEQAAEIPALTLGLLNAGR